LNYSSRIDAEEADVNIADWLKNLGLGQYEQAFRDNEISADEVLTLTGDDLRDIGVTLVGHRRKLLDAIAALRAVGAVGGPTAGLPPSKRAADAVSAEAERRQLTVMFCDLVGSVALSARLDPEDLRSIVGDYQRCSARIIEKFGGFVAQYAGDGVLAYFGYPQAHEDDAERAVRAALALIEAAATIEAPEPLQMRVGIATGLAVVGHATGEGGSQEQSIVGETPNLAARLQSLAEPNTIVVAEGTRRQVGSLFDLLDLGPQDIKGFAEQQRVWRVAGESRIQSRFEALRSGDSPLIGRDEEIDLLKRRWRLAREGEGRVLLLSAEPGVGKSRLATALVEMARSERCITLQYFCSPHHQDSALFPVIAQLERAAGFERGDTPEVKFHKLETLVTSTSKVAEDVVLLAELLLLPLSSGYGPASYSPQRKKEKTLDVLVRQLAGLASVSRSW
jgi:class 3 adenylate cyclase